MMHCICIHGREKSTFSKYSFGGREGSQKKSSLRTLLIMLPFMDDPLWTLNKDDERRLEAAEMWCYRRMLRISWKEKRPINSIELLHDLQTRRELLAQIIKRKMAFILDIHAETIGIIWLRHALLE